MSGWKRIPHPRRLRCTRAGEVRWDRLRSRLFAIWATGLGEFLTMHCRLISDYSGAHAAIPTVQGVGSDDCWFLNIFCNGSPLRKKVAFIAKFIIAPALLLVVLVAVRIYTYGNNAVDVQGDAAIVLGAAVWGNEVSPVF